MKCPHCGTGIHAAWSPGIFLRNNQAIGWVYRSLECPECSGWTFEIARHNVTPWKQVEPIGSTRGPVPSEVPSAIADDYKEACVVLPFSPKASAALARRCLQTMLHDHGYRDRDLSKEIDLLLNEPDPKKGIPLSLRMRVDGIRNFGNFAAHPVKHIALDQVIDVEPEEAEWCLDVVEEAFEFFYVAPARAKTRKDALDAKLKAAGKPASKG